MPKGSVGDCLGALSGAGAVGLYGVYIALIDTNDVATDLGPSQSADTIAQALVANRDDAQTAAYFGQT